MRQSTRQRHIALAKLLNGLNDERGPLDTAEDKAEIGRYMLLLAGPRLRALRGLHNRVATAKKDAG